VKLLARLLVGLLLLLFIAPGAALAQSGDVWQELRTQQFAILYEPADAATAQSYAAFVDGLYDEVAALFGHRTATPITLRLYPSLEAYQRVNPLARSLTGIVAHADYRRREVVVIVPQTRSQTPDEIQNNVRHELTHIVASDLSDERLNVGFQEGLAQYVEHPSRELEAKIQLLRRAADAGALPRWSELDDRDSFYRQPERNYPASLSIVAFLVQRDGFARLREFLTISARSSGYRSALERTYGASPDALEQEWLAWLPSYLNGGYRQSATTAYDLSRAEGLLRAGDYAGAQKELADAVAWLKTTDQADTLRRAEELLARAGQGLAAGQIVDEARAALADGDYARAAARAGAARSAFDALGDTRQHTLLAEIAARAARGQQAEDALAQAGALAGAWRYPQARALADRAAADFEALGAGARAADARALRATLDARQSLLGMGLLAAGVLGVLASLVRRITVREAEAW
jgi:hypothetical protein